MYNPFDPGPMGRIIQGDFIDRHPVVRVASSVATLASNPSSGRMIGKSWVTRHQERWVKTVLQPDGRGITRLPTSFAYSLGRTNAKLFLPRALQARLEAELGEDLSAVRVRVGPEPEAIGARAFAIGNDVYVSPKEYRPTSVEGFRLLAHECTHVVQQRRGSVQTPEAHGLLVVQDPELEEQADRVAELAVQRRWGVTQLKSTSAASSSATRQALVGSHWLQRSVAQTPWYCKLCNATGTTSNAHAKRELPPKGCKYGKNGKHDWKLGTIEEQQKKTESLIDVGMVDEEDDPQGFKKCKNWDQLSNLIAKWATGDLARLESCAAFSNVSTAWKAKEAVEKYEKTSDWNKARNKGVSVSEEYGKTLVHVGILQANIVKEKSTVFTFYGLVANVYLNGSKEVKLLRNKENAKDSQGSCHTEQICMYYLHQELCRLKDTEEDEAVFDEVQLLWHTEKEMCSFWCQPALALFRQHWEKQKVAILSSEV